MRLNITVRFTFYEHFCENKTQKKTVQQGAMLTKRLLIIKKNKRRVRRMV